MRTSLALMTVCLLVLAVAPLAASPAAYFDAASPAEGNDYGGAKPERQVEPALRRLWPG